MVIQEAVANVVAHARATTCRVGIFYDTTCITAVVEDNGRGFERLNEESNAASAKGSRLGLHGMAAHAHYLRGDLHVDSTPGWGTSICAQVPYSSNGDTSRERWKVLVACTQPLIRAGLVRLLETSEPSVQVLGELATLEDLTEAVSLLQPDMIVLDDQLLEQYAAARQASGDTVERPVVAVVVAAARGDALLDGAVFSRLAEGRDVRTPAAQAARLTACELELRDLLAEGLADKQIVTRLGSPSRPWRSTLGRCSGRPVPAPAPCS